MEKFYAYEIERAYKEVFGKDAKFSGDLTDAYIDIIDEKGFSVTELESFLFKVRSTIRFEAEEKFYNNIKEEKRKELNIPVPIIQLNGNIAVLNICDVMNYLGIEEWDKDELPAFKLWIKEKGYHYYARPKENFFIREAVREAEEEGKKAVIVEDMS